MSDCKRTNKNLYGTLPILLMNLLEQRDMDGYEMIQVLWTQSDEAIQLESGSLFPVLCKLEQQQAVRPYLAPSDHVKRQVKKWSLTDKGRRILREQKAEWSASVDMVKRMLDHSQEN